MFAIGSSVGRGVVACAVGAAMVGGLAAADELPRRGRLGVMIGPGDTDGLLIVGTVAWSGAADAGLREGDVLVGVEGKDAKTMAALGEAMGDVGAGDVIEVEIVRGGDRMLIDLRTSVGEATRLNGRDVEYGHVTIGDGSRLRTLLSLPEGAGEDVPVVFYVQGISCSSVELSGGSPNVTRAQLEGFDAAGFGTFRVEKPGCGDSEGGPCSELGFDRELEGYVAGLEQLLADPRIDADRVYVYGVSMGGIMAPYMAAEHDVAGIAVWGTGISNWMEYLIQNQRNQAMLFGMERRKAESYAPAFVRFAAKMCGSGMTPREMVEEDAAFGMELMEIGLLNSMTGYAGRHARFHAELTARDVFGAWAESAAPVLVMHGEYDWVALEEESELIVDFVNELAAERAELVRVPEMDHGFTTHAAFADSLANAFQGDWDNAVGEIVLGWIGRLEGKRADGGEVVEIRLPIGS